MQTRFMLVAVLLVTLAGGGMAPAGAAGGSSVPSAGPEEEAANDYNRGLRHRDKAWELEKLAVASRDPGERDELLAKAEREYAKAIQAFREATEADPRMHQAFSSLGYALRKTGDYPSALEAYDRALELEPGYAEAVEYRAEAYLGLNRLEDAKAAYMELFRGDRQRADELLEAMKGWVAARRADPSGVDAAAVEEFAAWVEERAELAGQTADLGSDGARASW